MHLQTVIDQLRSMRLTTMAESLKNRISTNDADGLEPAEFVALLVDDEYSARKRRKMERMISRANFKPDQATIENILYEGQRGFTKKDIIRFTSTEWVENRRNIIITGPTGCGKSYLAEAIGYKACTMGYPTPKIRYAILDDFLMGSIDCRDAEALMDIIEEKDQTGSVIVTTQFPVPKWHSRLPDPTIADAICDRLVHNAIQFNLKGESLRKKTKLSPKMTGNIPGIILNRRTLFRVPPTSVKLVIMGTHTVFSC